MKEDKTYEQCYYESIKCHHNNIAIYFKEELSLDENSHDLFILKNYNFAFIRENQIKRSSFYALCKYDYYILVNVLLQNKDIDVNEMMDIFESLFLHLYKTAFHLAVDKDNIDIVKLLLATDKLDHNILKDYQVSFLVIFNEIPNYIFNGNNNMSGNRCIDIINNFLKQKSNDMNKKEIIEIEKNQEDHHSLKEKTSNKEVIVFVSEEDNFEEAGINKVNETNFNEEEQVINEVNETNFNEEEQVINEDNYTNFNKEEEQEIKEENVSDFNEEEEEFDNNFDDEEVVFDIYDQSNSQTLFSIDSQEDTYIKKLRQDIYFYKAYYIDFEFDDPLNSMITFTIPITILPLSVSVVKRFLQFSVFDQMSI